MRVRVLGVLEVEDDDGQAVVLAGARQRALLAALAVDVGYVVSAERLLDHLWGEEAAGDGRNALQHHISRLRKTIGRERIASRDTGYLLAVDADDVDAARFGRLASEGRAHLHDGRVAEAAACFRSAEALWRGPPLDEFPEEWAHVESARLQRLHLDLVEDRVDADLRLGRHQALVAELETLVVAQPYRERLWGHLMVALYRCGRQTDALATFQRVREVLADAHGLDPGPELRDLEAAILRRDKTLAWAAQVAKALR